MGSPRSFLARKIDEVTFLLEMGDDDMVPSFLVGANFMLWIIDLAVICSDSGSYYLLNMQVKQGKAPAQA